MKFQPIIGLEIHVQLKTKSKMFCGCPNGFGLEKEPNVNICPVCTGQPGSLPVINQEAVRKVLKTGLALNCQISDFSKFDRKNYFYPDLPKGYQISQYDSPFCLSGYLELDSATKIKIRRIHLEEDTGRLVHPTGVDYSLVDFNRAGVPLMELVTEPDIKSAAEAKEFCQELQLILRYLDVSDADMEKGQMRCEVNISLCELKTKSEKQKTDEEIEKKLGTKVEIKNLNSFRAVERAIEHEIERQSEILEAGDKIIQETRGWSDEKQKTFSQRIKEEAHDYRYFPEPDLPPLTQLLAISDQLSAELPEMPQAKRKRFVKEFNLPANDIEVFVNNKELADYFENVISDLDQWQEDKKKEIKAGREKLTKLVANYLINELPRITDGLRMGEYKLNEKITEENFAEFILLISNQAISSSAAQTVLAEMFKTGIDPSHIIGEKELGQISDEERLEKIIGQVIKNNSRLAEEYKKGKKNILQYLIGQAMKETKGRANPQIIRKLMENRLKKGGDVL